METVTVAKKFDFHAAHRLPHHSGQCRRLHGHTYSLEVAVTGPMLDRTGESDEGMLIDFTVLKDMYKMLIEPYVEHEFLNASLTRDLPVPYHLWTTQEDVEDEPERIPLTTAEGLAAWCHKSFQHGLFVLQNYNPNLIQVQVTVWETPTSYAQVGTSWHPRNG